VIHRGTKEIGGSCVEIRTSQTRVLIDLGMPLSLAGKPIELDFLKTATEKELKDAGILPNIQGLYRDETPSIDAVILSHAHQDHHGLLGYIHPDIPVYLSAGAAKLLEVSDIFLPLKIGKFKSMIIQVGRTFEIKDLKITPYLVDHSAFDALAFLIEGDKKRIFYTGDFRRHGRKGILTQNLMDNPPAKLDCLIMEGTCIGRNDKDLSDESSVESALADVLSNNGKITFFMTSSQNIDRLVTAYRACKRTESLFIIDLYTAFILDFLQTERKTLPQYTWEGVQITSLEYHADKLIQSGHADFVKACQEKAVTMKEIKERKNKMLFLTRDNRIFHRFIKKYTEMRGAVVVYSMWEGYITEDFRKFCLENYLDLRIIHVSGHASAKDLADFANALKPKMLIPIHTEHADKFSEFFTAVHTLQDSEVLDLN